MSMLERYGTNLTKLAEDGKLDPVVGRDKEIDCVTEILIKRGTKRNACLIGKPGVGKTAIAQGLAQRIADGNVPKAIEGKQVITLELRLLIAENNYLYRAKFEESLKRLLEKIKQAGDIVIMIDELHTHIATSGFYCELSVGNILKPALARGEFQCIGATTTLDKYAKRIEKDPALKWQFQPVPVPEPTVDETILILKGLREKYGIHHSLRYTDDALVAAAQLSSQYVSDRFLPEKAIDLIDVAGSHVRLRHDQFARQLPEESRDLEEVKDIKEEQNEAVRGQDFEVSAEKKKKRKKRRKTRRKENDFDEAFKLQDRVVVKLEKDEESSKAKSKARESSPTVIEADIRQVVSTWTGIPLEKISADENKISTDEEKVGADKEKASADEEWISDVESDKLLKMEETLHQRVIGQVEAVKAISRAIRRAKVGLRSPNRPIASFIFCGPTGVGKTELAKAVVSCYSGSKEAMVRLDMSEFMEKHSVSKLIGAPPGYIGYGDGGQLTGAVRERSNTVILFDEIEKAHPDVFNLLLQIMDDGRLTDSIGDTVDFKNTILIMTSNVGSSTIEKGGDFHRICSLVNEELKCYFKPEFLNRLDEIIVFRQLTKTEVKKIADIMLTEVVERLKKKKIDLQVTEGFRNRVVDEGYCPSYGARPLRRAIMRFAGGQYGGKNPFGRDC